MPEPPRKAAKRKLPQSASIIGGKRFHTRVTPTIRAIAKRFPGEGAATVKRIANFVFESTPLKETVWDNKRRHGRTAEEVLKREQVDLLHCYDRGHVLISILAAKKIPAWTVISMDYRKFVHSYVETIIGGKIYTIAFKSSEPPIFTAGRCEKAILHAPGTSFVRARELADFGVRDSQTFKRFVEQMLVGKVKDKIRLGPDLA